MRSRRHRPRRAARKAPPRTAAPTAASKPSTTRIALSTGMPRRHPGRREQSVESRCLRLELGEPAAVRRAASNATASCRCRAAISLCAVSIAARQFSRPRFGLGDCRNGCRHRIRRHCRGGYGGALPLRFGEAIFETAHGARRFPGAGGRSRRAAPRRQPQLRLRAAIRFPPRRRSRRFRAADSQPS